MLILLALPLRTTGVWVLALPLSVRHLRHISPRQQIYRLIQVPQDEADGID
jgi:hypothetical protein